MTKLLSIKPIDSNYDIKEVFEGVCELVEKKQAERRHFAGMGDGAQWAVDQLNAEISDLEDVQTFLEKSMEPHPDGTVATRVRASGLLVDNFQLTIVRQHKGHELRANTFVREPTNG